MSFRINTNTASAFSSYQLQKGQQALSESLERLSTDVGAQNANQVADAALEYIPRQRSQVGSNANQLKSSISTLSSAMINTISEKSEIEDVDFAEESMNLNKIKLLGKTQAFAQAQANTSAKKILDLFG